MLEKNLNALKLNNPTYWNSVRLEELRKDYDEDNYKVEKTKSGHVTLKVKTNENFKYIHSKYDPRIKEERYLSAFEFKDKLSFMFFGVGLGYLPLQIKNKISRDNKVFIIEPDINIFKAMIRNVDITEIVLDRRFTFLIMNDTLKELFYSITVAIDGIHPKKIELFNNRQYIEIFPDMCKTFNKRIVEVLQDIAINMNTINLYSNAWLINSANSLKYMEHSIMEDEFDESFKGKPAIIVSAGPSLNKNVEMLKQAKGKALIICVYTALKVLDNHNIRPDIVVAIDSKQLLYDQYKNIEFDMPLLHSPNLGKEVLASHKGNKILTLGISGTSYLEIFKHLGKTARLSNTGGSVACTATEFARQLGANPIVFIGQDLAFTGNKTHASGTYYDGENDIFSKPLEARETIIKVPGLCEKFVTTDFIMNSFLRWFESYIEMHEEKTPELVFINATEGGAMIKGMDIMTLENVINTYCDKHIEVSEIMEEKFKNPGIFSTEEKMEILKLFKGIVSDIDVLYPELTKGWRISLEIEKLYEYTNYPKRNVIEKLSGKLEKINTIIFDKIIEIRLMMLLFQHIVFNLKEMTKENVPDELYRAKQTVFFLISIKDIFDTTKTALTEIIDFLEDK